MTVKLFDLAAQYRVLLDYIMEADDGADFAPALDELTEAFEDKAEGMFHVIRTLEANAQAIKDEQERLSRLARTCERGIGGLLVYMKAQMVAAGIEKIDRPTWKAWLQNSPPAVEITDIEQVPLRYRFGSVRLPWEAIVEQGWAVGTTQQVDKRAVLEDFKREEVQPFGVRVTQGRHLRFR